MQHSSQDPIGELPVAGDPLPEDAVVLSDLDSVCLSCFGLQSRSLVSVELPNHNGNPNKTPDDASKERDELRSKVLELEEANLKERFEFVTEIELSRARVSEIAEERNRRDGVISEILESIRSAKEIFSRISERMGGEQLEGDLEERSNFDDELEVLFGETKSIQKISLDLESKFLEYEEMRRKEKKQFENSIVCLTEENRDINSLLRLALVEKEEVEKSLSRMKNGEQKRVAILQFAERGLQKVGFGFMRGAAAEEWHSDHTSNLNASTKSDGGECEEEVVSLASTVEKIMKNLRLEISGLKHSLDKSRSDSERLLTLVDQQAEKIKESTLHIKELQERENMLAQNVEELTAETTEAGEEVARWREACELEVEAGKLVIEQQEKKIAILQGELTRTKSALDTANSQLLLKERLAATAMVAQAASEASLQLADNRYALLRERIEELMKQVEEDDCSKKERTASRRKPRHVCWPWRALKYPPASRARGGTVASWAGNTNRRMMPDMEALLHFI